MKILIIGGGGMIGQAIAQEHLLNGDEVFIYDNFSNEYNDYHSLLGKVLDRKDHTLLYHILDLVPDIISYQAARVGVAESQYKPKLYCDFNINSLAELIQGFIVTKTKIPIIFAGSMGIYGEGTRVCPNCGKFLDPITKPRETIHIKCPDCSSITIPYAMEENAPHVPLSIYGLTKSTQENMLRIYSGVYDVPVTSLRYFSVYSTTANPNNPYTGLLQIVVNKILNSDDIKINEDGEQVRDLIHCEDIAKLHVKCTRNLLPKFNAFNVGNGFPVSFSEIVNQIHTRFKSSKPIVYTGAVRLGDVRGLYANIDKVTAFDWKPIRNIWDDINTYCDWVKQNKETFIQDDTCAKADDVLHKLNLLR